MAAMPDPIETSSNPGGAGRFFRTIENWFNDPDPATRRNNRTAARAQVGSAAGFAGIGGGATLSGSDGGITHFNRHWRGGPAGWWPNVPTAVVNAQMSSGFVAALDKVLAPGNDGLRIRLSWNCVNRDINSSFFTVTTRETGGVVWIEITSPRSPGGIGVVDEVTLQPNYGWNQFSDLPAGSAGPFTVLGDLEVSNYNSIAGVDNSFDNDLQQPVTNNGFRESWSFFPIHEPIQNGPQALVGLRYSRDSWRRLDGTDPDDPDFEEKSLHSETGYLLWDGDKGHAYRVISLPRGVTVFAVAQEVDVSSSRLNFVADARSDNPLDGGIVSNPVLSDLAPTARFTSEMTIDPTGTSFEYTDVAEQTRNGEKAEHTDKNTLERI